MTDAVLVPIPPEDLERTKHRWLPFLESIARQTGDDLDAMVARIGPHDVQLFIIWDAASNMALAVLGLRVFMCGKKRVAEGVWLTGAARHLWEHLLPELEHQVKTMMGCQRMKLPCRPGWKKTLAAAGYRETHRILEKEI